MINFWDYNAWGGFNVIAVLLVSLLAASLLKRAFPVICVDRMEDAHLKELFFNYYEASEDEQDALSHCLTEFFDSIEGHTKSVEATANFLADEFGVYPEDIPEILQNIRPDSSNELSERIFSLISEIFPASYFASYLIALSLKGPLVTILEGLFAQSSPARETISSRRGTRAGLQMLRRN